MSGLTVILALQLLSQSDLLKELISNPILKRFADHSAEYTYSLLYDRGLFAGIGVRRYLRQKFREYVGRMPSWRRYPRLKDAATMSFAMLKDLTGIELAVCATNVSQKRSLIFSANNTPDFPVVEAVGMSACFPLAFKPVYIDAPGSDPVLGALRGLWLDGGILNNVPVHAFDDVSRKTVRGPTQPSLNPGMLALRLVEGAPRSFETFDDPRKDSLPLVGLMRDLFDTLMVPGRDGQFLTAEERSQSIDLFTFDLSLFEFSPSEFKARNPAGSARLSVVEYFRA
jgi:NTE family protein